MEPTPQGQPQGQPQDAWQTKDALKVAFEEYRFLADSTDRITDRRQTVNTLFVSINALFLTGVGYLLFQFLQNIREAPFFLLGFVAIAAITGTINRAWLRLSESNRRLVDLRIRYLEQLETHLRHGGAFPEVETPLKKDEIRADGAPFVKTRGTYTLEEVLYNPEAKKEPFGFSRAEQRIGKTFTFAYWLALAIAIIAWVVDVVLPLYVQGFPHL
jgi:hypothetical protein